MAASKSGYARSGRNKSHNASVAKKREWSSESASEMKKMEKRIKQLEDEVKQDVKLWGTPARVPFYFGAQRKYFPIPVTKALPPQVGTTTTFVSGQLRNERKVYVRGVKVEFKVSHFHGFSWAGVLYRARPEQVWPVIPRSDGVPDGFEVGRELEPNVPALLDIEETGFTANRDGPYEVREQRNAVGQAGKPEVVYSLASRTGTMLDCHDKKGFGGPFGKLEWRIDGGEKHKGYVTGNARVPSPDSGAVGIEKRVAFNTYWDIGKWMEFTLGNSQELVAKEHWQIMMMLDSDEPRIGTEEGYGGPSGHVEKVSVTFYYSS
jgi:hypothetical protein